MFWITIRRIIKSGWINFKRSGLISTAAVLITTITLSVITALILFQAMLTGAIEVVKNKVDITVFFSINTSEDQILTLKQQLEQLPEVAVVDYTSADQEVLEFRERHANDYLTLQALDELGDNPFGGSFRIKAVDSGQYESIAALLEGDSALAKDNATLIERVNYSQNKQAIDRLNALIAGSREGGLAATILFIIISVTIMFTTVRLTIYTVREEIGIMRLVGASKMYARGPFIVEGFLYGFFAWLITIALFFPLTYLVNRGAGELLGFDVYHYYIAHLAVLGGITFVVAAALGFLSSWLAVRKYLNV
ncbi:MAG TPA: permease-like cell division protein FtsX [Candidatus Paceibacterota bacterium]|nr:permease-like cell division protein FtsX [Candidatus Paceibacterota bacterium]